jgi:hypothetical protein
MGFTRAAFTPTDGIKNTTTYPTTPASETEARKQVQDNLDQMRDAINALEIELEDTGGAGKIGCTGTYGDIQEFITAVEAAGSGSTPGAGVITNAMMATDVKIGSLALLTTTDKDSLVEAINELVTTIASAGVPSGLIAQWHGLISAIPTGWVLCDGTNSTPNLSDKFIMGTTSQGTMNSTGGSNTTTLTSTQLPAHTHTGTTASSGAHTHDYDANSGTYGTSGPGSQTASATTASTATSSNGAHTHTFTTDSTGTGSAYDSRPAYYALAYIMKT